MAPRPLVLASILLASLVAAGCVDSEPLTGASISERVSRVNDMLENAPGTNVRPTGNVKEFDLYLHPMRHELYPGAVMQMWGFSLDPDPSTAMMPGPTLRVTEGDQVIVNFQSTVAGFNHTLHWHGQHVPWEQDGVPFLTQSPIEPGEVFTYAFIAKPAGTYWYHCHVDAPHHIDMGMYGVLIVDPQDPADDPHYDREFLMVLDDMDRFHLEGGQTPGENMPQSGDPDLYEEWARRQAADLVNRNPQVSDRVTGTPLREHRGEEYGYPVTHAPYTANYNTWLINGFSFPYTEPLVVQEGDTIRIRMVNVGNSFHAMHLHGHHMLVTHKDGILLASPYWVDTLILGPSERYDLYVPMNNPGLWDFHDHIGKHTTNDNIFPGGAMTMLCYEGHAHRHCDASGGHAHGGHDGGRLTAGDFFRWSGHALP